LVKARRDTVAKLPGSRRKGAGQRARVGRQLELARLGQLAVGDGETQTLLAEVARSITVALSAEMSAIGERLIDGKAYRLRAACGWDDLAVGSVAESDGTPVEHLFAGKAPSVVIHDTREERRFAIPAPLVRNGVRSALYVPIPGRESAWGSLSVYSRKRRRFKESDAHFLRAVAGILALVLERRQTEIARGREHEMLHAIFDCIPVMISIFDSEGKLLRANREWEKVLGWSVEDAAGVDLLSEVYPDPDRRRQAVDAITHPDRRWRDFRPRTRDGRLLETSWSRVEMSDGTRIGFGIDLTDRRRAEAALEDSEARFSRIFQASPVALSMSTLPEGRIVAVNGNWLDLLGYRLEEVLGHTTDELGLYAEPESRGRAIAQLARDGELRNFELRLKHRSGEIRDVLISAVPTSSIGMREHALSALTDITSRKRVESERDRHAAEARLAREGLATLSRRLLSAQEEERRRLAVELHDELGQVLTATRIQLDALSRSHFEAPSPHLGEAIDSVEMAMKRVRDLALDLRPSVLDDLGLPPALRWYADRFARATQINIEVVMESAPNLDAGIQIACFRVAQEALTNVARHAKANRVRLELNLLAGELELIVRDDGVGFDVAEARHRATSGTSVGLLGMRERVALTGGTLEISSEPGRGSTIRARFPLATPGAGSP
jgi:two-component system sensor histidine kinase UhpB